MTSFLWAYSITAERPLSDDQRFLAAIIPLIMLPYLTVNFDARVHFTIAGAIHVSLLIEMAIDVRNLNVRNITVKTLKL